MKRRQFLGLMAAGVTVAALGSRPVSAEGGGRAGELLGQETLATGIRGAKAWKVRYRSLDVNGAPHDVTGMVVAPAKAGEGRPLLTWCHGTTGLGNAACPSAQPDPARELSVYFALDATQQIDYGVPGLQGYIDAGYVVCATDYQGLGSPGMHQYVVNRTNARDALFLARAARSLPVGAGPKLAAVGWSQGGGAAAALAELDDQDFGDLQLVGTALMSPGVPSLGLHIPGGVAASLADAKAAPDAHLLMMVMGFAAGYPQLKVSDILTPLGESTMNAIWENQPVHHMNDTIARLFRLKGAFMHANPLSRPDWKAAITAGCAGRVKPRCPVLLCIDGFGGGTVVPVSWQHAYADAVRALGAQVEIQDYPHDDHISLPASCTPAVQTWLRPRLG